jgi:structural maintenance of chromosome 4
MLLSFRLLIGPFIQADGGFTVVPESTLVVARTAYRNNSSKYTLNGHPSSFTEVTTLLKSRGIDLEHKRFLILQVPYDGFSS